MATLQTKSISTRVTEEEFAKFEAPAGEQKAAIKAERSTSQGKGTGRAGEAEHADALS
jgi:hypothetical protein